MKIIVTGCGKTGVAAIESLVSEGHDVIAIDNRLEAIEEIRSEHSPHIPKKMLEDIVKSELENQDDRKTTNKDVQDLLEKWLQGVK